MAEQKEIGIFQLDNGFWGYRFIVTINGKKKAQKRVKDENGKPFRTKRQASKARSIALAQEQARAKETSTPLPHNKEISHKTVQELYQEYCDNGRNGKAYTTIVKQDSLWKNHLKEQFGHRYLDEISVAEIQDYLAELYYVEGRAYSYVNSFLKMFYLIFGQAYSRNYLDTDIYNRLCINKDTKIHMPKMKVDEETDIVYFNDTEILRLDEYFKDTNAETAYMLGRYCGLRINECYGLKWDKINLEKGTITIDRQMQYQNGLIKLVSLKTRNAKRTIYMSNKLKNYLLTLKRQQEIYKQELEQQRQQNQTFIEDIDGKTISSLALVNALPNGKIQTVNSMKYHSRTLQGEYNINFKYHYLRHTYGTNLAALNTPEYLLCNQMGHSNSNVTHKYYVAISDHGVKGLLEKLEKL